MTLLLLEKTPTYQHMEDQRTLTVMWCSPELEEAVRQGYKIVHVHEIWNLKESRVGLFADYMNTWLKLKEEVSGWPEECTTGEQHAANIAAYETREGIVLEPARIARNNRQQA